MDPALLAVAQSSFHLHPSYVSHALQHSAHHQREIHSLLQHRRLPPHPWPDPHILSLLHSLSSLDSNTFHPPSGAGEREGRVLSPLVSARHFSFSHGVGRSGALTGQQPKAIGSSLLSALTTALTLDALHTAGLKEMKEALLLPVATGMSLTLALLALASQRPTARTVLLGRIDQKTCIKCVQQAGLTPHILPLSPTHSPPAFSPTSSDPSSHPPESPTSLSLHPSTVEDALSSLPPGSVLCLLSVTSCFAPRLPDDVVALSRLCLTASLPHIVNNAYGLQSATVCAALDRACRVGRVDLVVQSMDKNFLVPVGGAIACAPALRPSSHPSVPAPSKPPGPAPSHPPAKRTEADPSPQPEPSLLKRMSGLYPGRASASAHIDLLVTLLSLGDSGYRALLARRAALFHSTRTRLDALAQKHGERLLASSNDISMAVTLTPPVGGVGVGQLGGMLFSRGVSGCRVYRPGVREDVGGCGGGRLGRARVGG